jgi:lantibiotic modifying enzyme
LWNSIINEDDKNYSSLTKKLLGSLILKEKTDQYSLADGYSGLAVVFGYANLVFPGAGYDILTHKYLKASIDEIEAPDTTHSFGSFSGLTGVALAASYAANGSDNYKNLLLSLDKLIFKGSDELAAKLKNSNKGIAQSSFDIISGAAGIGSYLLLRKNSQEGLEALEQILNSITYLTTQNQDLLYFYTPNKLLFEWEKAVFKDGAIDCGMAHGVSGVLSLLSVAYMQGVEVDRSKESITAIADWLIKRAKVYKGGINWPDTVQVDKIEANKNDNNKLEQSIRLSDKFNPARVAWCYGNPGTARALFLAGKVLKRSNYMETAISGMEAAYKRMKDETEVDSPTFCHGISGILEITLRFLNDTNHDLFKEQASILLRKLYGLYDPDSIFGYKNIDRYKKLQNDSGVLEGVGGIITTLMAATSNIEPKWDHIFLIS